MKGDEKVPLCIQCKNEMKWDEDLARYECKPCRIFQPNEIYIPNMLAEQQKSKNSEMKILCDGMTDSGKRQEFETGAVRDSADDKPRPDLISPYANEREGAWLAKGAKKYASRNWEQGMPISRCIASLERHVIAYKKGKRDEDHMAAIRTNAGFILHYEEMIKLGVLPKALDDMPKYEGEK